MGSIGAAFPAHCSMITILRYTQGIKAQHPRWTIVGQYIDGAELIAWPKLLEDADQGKLDAVLVRSCPWLDVSCMGDVTCVGKTGGTCLAVFMD